MVSGMLTSVFYNLDKIRNELPMVAVKVLRQNDNIIIDLNTQMLSDGVDAVGAYLGDYSPTTVQIKKAKGQRYDHITLEDTGDFKDAFFVEIENGKWHIDSKDYKSGMLMDQYGADIFGNNPTDEDEILTAYLEPELYAYILLNLEL